MESMERGGSTTSAQSPTLFQHLVALLESGRLIAEAFSISSACQSRVSGDTVPTSLELIFADESRFSQRDWENLFFFPWSFICRFSVKCTTLNFCFCVLEVAKSAPR